MYIVWQRINRLEWRLNSKNSDKAKALKAYAGCVKSVGVNKCKFTEETRPELNIQATVEEDVEVDYEAQLEAEPDSFRARLIGEFLPESQERDSTADDAPPRRIGDVRVQYTCNIPHSLTRLKELKEGCRRAKARSIYDPYAGRRHPVATFGTPPIIRTTKFDDRINEMHKKGAPLTMREGLWTLAGPFDDILGEIYTTPASTGGMRYLNVLVYKSAVPL